MVTFTEGSKASVKALWCTLAIAGGHSKGFADGNSNSANLDTELDSPGAVVTEPQKCAKNKTAKILWCFPLSQPQHFKEHS